jgi:hypothetical protein
MGVDRVITSIEIPPNYMSFGNGVISISPDSTRPLPIVTYNNIFLGDVSIEQLTNRLLRKRLLPEGIS